MVVADLGDRVDHVHAVDDLAEDRVAAALVEEVDCRSRLMKNWQVAESGLLVRAMAIVPRLFVRPLPDSFLIGACFSGFSFIWSSIPPPGS